MRTALLALVVMVSACQMPSLKDRARSFGVMGKGFVRVVTPSITPSIDVKQVVVNSARGAVHGRIAAVAGTRVADAADAASQGEPISVQTVVDVVPVQPISISKSYRGGGRAQAPAPQAQVQTPVPAPRTTVTRVDAARATQFVARWNNNGKNQCKAYAVMQTCQDSCTSMLRAGAFDKSAPRGCSCVEQDGGC